MYTWPRYHTVLETHCLYVCAVHFGMLFQFVIYFETFHLSHFRWCDLLLIWWRSWCSKAVEFLCCVVSLRIIYMMDKEVKECSGYQPEKAPDPYRGMPDEYEPENTDTDCSIDSDDDLDHDEIKKPLKSPDNPMKLLQQGRVIVPHFLPESEPCGDDMAHVCRSQGNVGIHAHMQPNHAGLIWIGSSLSTMHKVPVTNKNLLQTKGSYCSVDNMHRSPSIMSKKLMSSRYSSVTVSECGTDMCSTCRICQMPGDDHDPLISPCRCAGSLRYVHTSCLKVTFWINLKPT